MARIVLTSFGSYGDVNPFLGLAAELRARGHHPLLALPPAYRSAVEREGLGFRPVRPDVDIHDRAFAARIMDPARGADVTFGEVLIPSLEQTAADLHDAARDADLLVTHPTSLTGPTVAQERGIPGSPRCSPPCHSSPSSTPSCQHRPLDARAHIPFDPGKSGLSQADRTHHAEVG